jgi:hypothetical protein
MSFTADVYIGQATRFLVNVAILFLSKQNTIDINILGPRPLLPKITNRSYIQQLRLFAARIHLTDEKSAFWDCYAANSGNILQTFRDNLSVANSRLNNC